MPKGPAVIPHEGIEVPTSPSLIRRVQADDPRAWRTVVELYSPLLALWCRRWGLQHADAENVVQDSFAALSRSVGQLRLDRTGATFRGWLWTVALNKARDVWREAAAGEVGVGGSAAGRWLECVEAEPDDTPSNEVEQAALVRRALELLACEFQPNTWQAFLQVVLDGRCPADVATELGMTPNAVYVAKSKVLTRLRSEYAGLFES